MHKSQNVTEQKINQAGAELNRTVRSVETDVESCTQYLTFQAGEECFALDILEVKELLEISHMTSVPRTPDFIRGVIDLRGNVVPVIDLAARLGRRKSEISKRSSIVMVEIKESAQAIGMLVDEVNEIVEIPQSQIKPTPNFGSHINTDFIDAMGEVDGEFIILINVNKVLSVEQMSSLEQIMNTDVSSHLSQQNSTQEN